ncbi:crossover junction endodeoxyribonuclease RusA [Micromonospora sp. Llam0]|uniref:RusA family crossover junction endodeoxyribonuclease n=1 Tax=Micromonospora sp. Llam0 TaxID=2485143 RepID=UPI000FA9E3F8|nr:RusA family crossover junction endodeoxyribonuclease [Micromonospora sp. Llam0]ROO51054.1 crossover junction endodeoxyribonuclease RusA [Micromonospora sp. Llam0]
MLRIVVYGQPAPQGSKRHVGKGVMVESSKKVQPWRTDVKNAAETALRENRQLRINGPVTARIIFSLPRPKAHYRTGRNAHLFRDNAPPRPATTPDLSKLIRSTEDALTAAGVWADDARLVEIARAAKVWCGEDPEALDRPGALIVIQPYISITTISPSSDLL